MALVAGNTWGILSEQAFLVCSELLIPSACLHWQTDVCW